jgi:hypothetical protein
VGRVSQRLGGLAVERGQQWVVGWLWSSGAGYASTKPEIRRSHGLGEQQQQCTTTTA